MNYSELLQSYIKKSNLTLDEISEKLSSYKLSATKQYLSKLQNGKTPPASDELNRALAEITGGDAESLLLAGHIEKAPPEVQDQLRAAHRYHIIFMLTKFLVDFLEYYRQFEIVDEYYLEKIEFANGEVLRELKYFLNTDGLKSYPELAAQTLAQIKRNFFQGQDKISYGSFDIDFTKYVDPNGNAIFDSNPYPEIVEMSIQADEAKRLKEIEERKAANLLIKKETLEQVNEKILFIEELENGLGIDITDPETRKKLKRAAKIAFIDED